MKTKDLPTLFVLSVVTGRNMEAQGIGGVYEVLNWMTGEQLFTHQLPRVAAEARPVLLAAFPELEWAVAEAKAMSDDDWKSAEKIENVKATWLGRYGETLAVPQMSEDQHERIDPMSELAEKVHPSRIIPVILP